MPNARTETWIVRAVMSSILVFASWSVTSKFSSIEATVRTSSKDMTEEVKGIGDKVSTMGLDVAAMKRDIAHLSSQTYVTKDAFEAVKAAVDRHEIAIGAGGRFTEEDAEALEARLRRLIDEVENRLQLRLRKSDER